MKGSLDHLSNGLSDQALQCKEWRCNAQVAKFLNYAHRDYDWIADSFVVICYRLTADENSHDPG